LTRRLAQEHATRRRILARAPRFLDRDRDKGDRLRRQFDDYLAAARRMVLGVSLVTAAATTLALTPAAHAQSASAAGHPDFSGLWFPGRRTQTPNPAPYTQGAQALADRYTQEFSLDDDPGRYCIWPGMPRAVWGAPFTVEIQQRPQDITIYWEGYGMYRKIYMADHNPPEPILPSAMGHSVAHWEGETLVVETTNLKPYPYMTRLATSSSAKVVERIHLEEREEGGRRAKYLVNELVLTDPKVYTEPIHFHAELVMRPDLQLLEYTCTDTLWEEYLAERGLTLPDLDALPEP
jgi:hypothetical protein